MKDVAMKTYTNRVLVAFAVVISSTVIVLSAFAIASNDSTVAPTTLEDVPGFRIDDQGALDDDTIRLWEAYQREKHVKQCMTDDGYSYTLDAAFPAGSLRAVADSVGALGNVGELPGDDNSAEFDAVQTNSDIDSLSPQQLNGYYLTLYGETAADVAYVDSTGFLPTGRNDFAQGGCFGAAQALPRISTITRVIEDDIRDETAIEMAKAAPCVTPNGVKLKDLEMLEYSFVKVIDSNTASEQEIRALEQDLFACYDKLERESGAASARAYVTVFNRHKKRLLDHAERYGAIENEIATDNECKQYLQTAVTELEDSWHEIDLGPANSG